MKRTKDMEPRPLATTIAVATAKAGQEVQQAVHEHHGFTSFHEGYAVLKEELDELWEEIKVNRVNRSRQRIHDEAIQVAAMAIEIAAIASMDRE